MLLRRRSRPAVELPGAPGEVTTAGGARFGGAFAALAHREFAWFWTGAIVSSTGSWMQLITVPFVVDELTHSTAWVGLAAFCAFLPTAALAPLGGPIADRYPRRRTLLWTQSLMMTSAVVLWLLWWTGTATPGLILACVLVNGIGNGLTIAAWQAFVSELVPREDLANALRLNTTQFTVARVLGPALSGLALATLGASATFLGNALSFVVVLLALRAIRPRPAIVSPDTSILRHFRDGLTYVRRRVGIRVALQVLAVYSLFGASVVQLAEPLARHSFHADAAAYGVMLAVFGVGGLCGSAFVLTRADGVRYSLLTIAGLLVYAGAQIGLAVAPWYAIGVLALAVMGVVHVVIVTSASTFIQLAVDDRYRGRVISLNQLVVMGGVPIGALLQALLSEAIGLQWSIVTAALAFVVVTVLIALRSDGLQVLDVTHPHRAEGAATRALVISDPLPETPLAVTFAAEDDLHQLAELTGSGPATGPPTQTWQAPQ
jgi:MFS family permease